MWRAWSCVPHQRPGRAEIEATAAARGARLPLEPELIEPVRDWNSLCCELSGLIRHTRISHFIKVGSVYIRRGGFASFFFLFICVLGKLDGAAAVVEGATGSRADKDLRRASSTRIVSRSSQGRGLVRRRKDWSDSATSRCDRRIKGRTFTGANRRVRFSSDYQPKVDDQGAIA